MPITLDDAFVSSSTLNMGPDLRRHLHLAGSILALVAVLCVGWRSHSYGHDLDLSQFTPVTWGLFFVLAVIYGFANLLLALSWRLLLRHCGAAGTHIAPIRIYGMSQLAKYVPGNIFHLAGRQGLGMAAGISAIALAKSTVWELGLLAAAGALFGWMVLPLLILGFPVRASAFLMFTSAGLIVYLLHQMASRQVASAFLCQIIFLIVSGAVFIALLGLIAVHNDVGAQCWLAIGGAYIVAWLAGLVTPGAPAGVGVREMILLLLLRNVFASADLLMAVLLGRLVSIIGDFIFFVGAFLIPQRFSLQERMHA